MESPRGPVILYLLQSAHATCPAWQRQPWTVQWSVQQLFEPCRMFVLLPHGCKVRPFPLCPFVQLATASDASISGLILHFWTHCLVPLFEVQSSCAWCSQPVQPVTQSWAAAQLLSLSTANVGHYDCLCRFCLTRSDMRSSEARVLRFRLVAMRGHFRPVNCSRRSRSRCVGESTHHRFLKLTTVSCSF